MKKLELNQMENLEGGAWVLNCSDALALGGMVLVISTGPIGWMGVAGLMLACKS
jgi:hypothetical protein